MQRIGQEQEQQQDQERQQQQQQQRQWQPSVNGRMELHGWRLEKQERESRE